MSNSSSMSLSSSMVGGKERMIASSTARIRAGERRERNRVLTGIVLRWSFMLEEARCGRNRRSPPVVVVEEIDACGDPRLAPLLLPRRS